MGVHDYHDGLPNYSPTQVLHDGCGECEERGADPSFALAKFDWIRFASAWRRAAQWNREGLPDLAKTEVPTFRVLWAIQLHLEHFGIPVGELPRAFPDPPEYEPDDGEAQRIAETYADAAAELDRDEAGEASRG